MRAAIDIGSNSLRLLAVDEEGRLIKQKVEETRLGICFHDCILTEEAMERTFQVLEQYQLELAEIGIEDVTFIATSAVRDAINRDVFLNAAKSRLHRSVRVLSGDEEAWYTFQGAVNGFHFPVETCCLIDIGGGSTELAFLQDGVVHGVSTPMGAVRYQVTKASYKEVSRLLKQHLPPLPSEKEYHFIGVGGTITTAAAVLKKEAIYSREAIHGYQLDKFQLEGLRKELAALPLEERKQLIGLPPKRADIILFGLDILAILFEIYTIEHIYVSDRGILDGILTHA